ncbi:MAG: hypothetical protein Q9173_002928 [Seirophora scorigena]
MIRKEQTIRKHMPAPAPAKQFGLDAERRRDDGEPNTGSGMDALAELYTGEVAPWGITSGTNPFVHAAEPADSAVMGEYVKGATKGLSQRNMNTQVGVASKTAKPGNVAIAIVDVVGMEFGKRPFRVHVDTNWHWAHVVNPVADRMRGSSDTGAVAVRRVIRWVCQYSIR